MAVTRRHFIASTSGTLALTIAPFQTAQPAEMVDVRMWPAQEYTRVTLEHDQPIKFKYFLVRSPKPCRLVVDIENLELTARLQKMISNVSPNDPFIQAVRIGQYSPNIVRLVMDLKTEVRPEVFSLKPIANYKYRLIFDVYPVGKSASTDADPLASVIAGLDNKSKPGDPLGELIAKNDKDANTQPVVKKPAEVAKSSVQKPATSQAKPTQTQPTAKTPTNKSSSKKKTLIVVVDPGHGGENLGTEANVSFPGGIQEKGRDLITAKATDEELQAFVGVTG